MATFIFLISILDVSLSLSLVRTFWKRRESGFVYFVMIDVEIVKNEQHHEKERLRLPSPHVRALLERREAVF